MATKTLRVFAEYTSTGFVPMPTAGNIDYGYTLGSTFPATTPTTFQTDNPDLVVTVTAMTDFYVWIRINGTAWNPSYTRNVRVYPDSPNINNVVMNMIIATGPAGIGAYTQIVQTSNRLYFNGATTDAVYNSKFAGKTYINELNFGTAPGLSTVATTGAYADLTGKPSLATVATSGLFTDLSSKPSGTAPLSYNSGTNSFVITQANTSTNGFLTSTDWNTFNNKYLLPAGGTIDQYVNGSGTLTTFPTTLDSKRLIMSVRNETGATLTKGTVVYIVGIGGNTPLVSKAIASSDSTSAQTLGVLDADINNNQSGTAVLVGQVTALNTSSFTEGVQLYLSGTTAGTYTSTKSLAPTHLVYVGIVTRSHANQGVIEVKIQNGYELDEIHDVQISSPADKDILYRDSVTSLWKHASISTVLGYTPYNGTNTSIKALFSASAPLSYSDGVYSISQATTSSNGYLSSTDWNTFNGKESALTFSTPLVRTTNTISINQASASTSGYLSSTDWNTFNNKGSGTGTVTSVAMTMPLGLSVSGSPITTSGTFGITLTAGYVIPSTTSTSEWDTAYTNRITSLTVTGSSGASTLISNVLNIPTYTLAGLGGQVALNGTGFVKISGTTISYDNSTYLTTASASSTYQTIITNPVTGTGTINELAYFNSATSIASLAVATYPSLTELAYVKGVTSSIQTQLNAKASTLSGTTNYVAKFTSSTGIGNSVIFDNGTNVGIGTITPTGYSDRILNIFGSASAELHITTTGSGTLQSDGLSIGLRDSDGSANFYLRDNSFMAFGTNDTERFRIASTGAATFSSTVGIGNAISAWGTGTFPKVLQVGNASLVTNGTAFAQLTNNMYFDGSVYRYITSNGASRIILESDGVITFNNAVSGTAGNTVSTTERMRIDSTGRVLIAGTTASGSPIFQIQKSDSTTNSSSYFWNTYSSGMMIRNSDSIANTLAPIYFYMGSSNNSIAGIAGIQESSTLGAIGFFTGGSGRANTVPERMRITSDGNVGIGTASPSHKLTVEGGILIPSDVNGTSGYKMNYTTADGGSRSWKVANDDRTYGDFSIKQSTTQTGSTYATKFLIWSNGNVIINGTTDPGYRLYVAGAIYATGNITANSDLTLKKNLKLIDNPIDKLMQLNGYAYQWKSDDSHQYGVIAQEVEKILPYAVSTGNDGIKGVSYNQIIPVLIEAIKTQQAEINTLKSKLA